MNWSELLETIEPESFFEWMGWNIKKAGLSHRGACPVHGGNNKTAFNFSPKYRCFYCHTHCGFLGDFVSVYAKSKKVSPDVARKAIAQWQGWDIQDVSYQPPAPKVKVIPPLPSAPSELPHVAEWERKTLIPLGQDPRFTAELIQRYGLLQGTYGRYKNRIVFPIHDHQGRWVGNNGRWIGNDFEENDVPKYLYSPAPFQTGSVLYGYDLAKSAPAWILHEGVTDVIRAHEHGTLAVAVLGAHLTLEQVSLLKNKPIVLAFDGDEAGRKGMRKAIQLLWQYHIMNIAIAIFPEGEDPGSLSKEAYQACLAQAISPHVFLQRYPMT